MSAGTLDRADSTASLQDVSGDEEFRPAAATYGRSRRTPRQPSRRLSHGSGLLRGGGAHRPLETLSLFFFRSRWFSLPPASCFCFPPTSIRVVSTCLPFSAPPPPQRTAQEGLEAPSPARARAARGRAFTTMMMTRRSGRAGACRASAASSRWRTYPCWTRTWQCRPPGWRTGDSSAQGAPRSHPHSLLTHTPRIIFCPYCAQPAVTRSVFHWCVRL